MLFNTTSAYQRRRARKGQQAQQAIVPAQQAPAPVPQTAQLGNGPLDALKWLAPINQDRAFGDAQKRFGYTQTGATNAFGLTLPGFYQSIANIGPLEQQRQGLLQRFLRGVDTSALQRMANQFQAAELNKAGSIGRLQSNQLAAQGASTATQKGALVNAQNQANEQAFQYGLQVNSPQAQQAAALQGMQAIQQGQQNPYSDAFNMTGALSYGRPVNTEPQDPGILGTLGQVAGIYSAVRPRAKGGVVAPGQAPLVGEEGPERVLFAQPGLVIPNARTLAKMERGSPRDRRRAKAFRRLKLLQEEIRECIAICAE